MKKNKNKKHKTTTVTVTVSEQTDKQHCDNTYHSRDKIMILLYSTYRMISVKF